MGIDFHGFLWSTEYDKSYSFGPSFTGGRVKTDDDPGLNPNGKPTEPFQCTPLNNSPCFENCVCKLIVSHKKSGPPFKYKGSNMCWDAVAWVRRVCQAECSTEKGQK